MGVPQVMAAVTLGYLGYKLFSPKKRKKASTTTPDVDLPSQGCGLYAWKPLQVDAVLDKAIVWGERDLERLALKAAREVYSVTPEGKPQPWPPVHDDTRALCIIDRIRLRASLRLAELADDDAGDDEVPGGLEPDDPEPPTEPPTLGEDDDDDLEDPETPEDPSEWPEYPPPAPVDLAKWTVASNYPTPGKFHQIGGPQSGTTLKTIAIKALAVEFYILHEDLAVAEELARREENWRAYREAINCCPWNHALYGSANQPGTPYYYGTPHDDHISLYPVHDDVAERLANGEAPRRRVSEDDPKVPAGGQHAFIWLPPLDPTELSEGRVKVEHAHWWTGDFRMMPPPEVLTLGLADVPPGRVWGCGGYQTSYEFEEDL